MAARKLGWVRGLLPIVSGLVCWQLFGNSSSSSWPPPHEWWVATRSLWEGGTLGASILDTLRSFAFGLLAVAVVGSLVGFALGEFRDVDRSLGPALEFLRATPSAVVVPIFVLLLGYNTSMTIVVIVFGAVWPVILSTRAAIRGLNPLLRDVGTTLHLDRRRMAGSVTVPALLPGVFLGLRIATPICLIMTLLVEIVAGVPGLGHELTLAQQSYQSALAYGLVCVVAVLALLVNGVVITISRLVLGPGSARV